MKAAQIAVLVLFTAMNVGPANAQENEYRIGPKDLLEVRVFEIPELNVERRVSDNGTISLPLTGEFAVAGLTSREAQDRLALMLEAKYVNKANVVVNVKEYSNKPISVVGAVARPGNLNISSRWTLLQALSAAGGLSVGAGRKIFILRRADNGLSDVLEIRTDDLLRGSASLWNIPIFPSDVVNVPARTIVTVFCLGEVKQPGALEFDSDGRISLLSVIAKAGGMTDRASSSIRIKRRAGLGKDVELVVNYKRIVAGKDPDPELEADDVVIVKESFF